GEGAQRACGHQARHSPPAPPRGAPPGRTPLALPGGTLSRAGRFPRRTQPGHPVTPGLNQAFIALVASRCTGGGAVQCNDSAPSTGRWLRPLVPCPETCRTASDPAGAYGGAVTPNPALVNQAPGATMCLP